eukprot:4819543-Karenia_brevis.AAC.1
MGMHQHVHGGLCMFYHLISSCIFVLHALSCGLGHVMHDMSTAMTMRMPMITRADDDIDSANVHEDNND